MLYQHAFNINIAWKRKLNYAFNRKIYMVISSSIHSNYRPDLYSKSDPKTPILKSEFYYINVYMTREPHAGCVALDR